MSTRIAIDELNRTLRRPILRLQGIENGYGIAVPAVDTDLEQAMEVIGEKNNAHPIAIPIAETGQVVVGFVYDYGLALWALRAQGREPQMLGKGSPFGQPLYGGRAVCAGNSCLRP